MEPRKDSPKKPRCSPGFTLVEVVTAALLGAMLLAIFLTFAFRFTKVFQELGGAEVKISSEANRVLDVIEGDLASSLMRQDIYEWMSYWNDFSEAQSGLGGLEKTGPSQGQNLATFELDRVHETGQDRPMTGVLLCITRAPDLSEEEKTGGDVISVAWRLAYLDPAIPEDPLSPGATYCLYRIVNSPDTTYEDFLAQEDLAQAWSGNRSSGGERFNVSPPYDINTMFPEFLQLRNVVEFNIKFYAHYLPGKSSAGPVSTSLARETSYHRMNPSMSGNKKNWIRIGGSSATNNTGPSDMAKLAHLFPVTAIVRLTVLSDEGVKYFRAAAIEGKRPGMKDLDQLIEQHGHTFQRTIVLPRPI